MASRERDSNHPVYSNGFWILIHPVQMLNAPVRTVTIYNALRFGQGRRMAASIPTVVCARGMCVRGMGGGTCG